METKNHSNWLEINLSTIGNNIAAIESMSKRPMMAVVKANAYGHGLVQIAKAASNAGISWFGVARIEEAIQLVNAGIGGRILVLGYTPPQAAQYALGAKIHLTLYDENLALAYSKLAQTANQKIHVHVKIDTGMGRLGVFAQDGLNFIKWLRTLPGLDVYGLFTHFARADEPAVDTTELQITKFDELITSLEASSLRPKMIHAANSGATICFPQTKYDLIRPGILMYGLAPSTNVPLPEGIKPALQWKTRLASLKLLPAQHGISYGHRYTTKQAEVVGAIAVGYADGFRRVDNNQVLINGKLAPVIGRVCMDQAMIAMQHAPNARIGDEVVLLGKQGDLTLSAEDIANRWNTINYEVIAALAERVQRVYFTD